MFEMNYPFMISEIAGHIHNDREAAVESYAHELKADLGELELYVHAIITDFVESGITIDALAEEYDKPKLRIVQFLRLHGIGVTRDGKHSDREHDKIIKINGRWPKK